MYVDFSSIFHRSSKDLSAKGRVNIPQDDTLWPEEWKTVYYKTYPRVPKIKLTRGALPGSFSKILRSRKSSRDFRGGAVEKNKLSKLLLYSSGLIEEKGVAWRRMYASGGGRFTVELYPLVFRGSTEIPSGVYHYNVKEHALDVLWKREFTNEDISELFVYDWVQNASFVLILTVTFWRSQMKYGERGYRYILLEAGHLGENIYLTAAALGIKCCGMGGTRDERVEQLLDIDGITESVIHSVILE